MGEENVDLLNAKVDVAENEKKNQFCRSTVILECLFESFSKDFAEEKKKDWRECFHRYITSVLALAIS